MLIHIANRILNAILVQCLPSHLPQFRITDRRIGNGAIWGIASDPRNERFKPAYWLASRSSQLFTFRTARSFAIICLFTRRQFTAVLGQTPLWHNSCQNSTSKRLPARKWQASSSLFETGREHPKGSLMKLGQRPARKAGRIVKVPGSFMLQTDGGR